MASISFPVTGLQPIPRDQPASPPSTAGGPQAVDPNQQDAPQGDTVTISATFPPAQAAQQSATVKLEEFSLFLTQTNIQTGQTGQPGQPTPAPAPANTQANTQTTAAPGAPQAATAASTGVPATANSVAAAAATGAPTQPGSSATPQQELTQLDQTLQQLGIDPQSISLFNRLGMLLYANDPSALQELVQALHIVDQQLSQVGGGANGATQTPGLAQDLLPPALQSQAQSQSSQGAAQVTPEPLTPLQVAAQPQAPAAPLNQLEGQTQTPQANSTATAIAVQLSFSDTQATFQEQPATPQAPSRGQSSGNGASTPQTNNLLVNFQELQLTFQEVEIQSPQQQTTGTATSSTRAQGRSLNIRA